MREVERQFLSDVCKIQFIRNGYLKGNSYHLVSEYELVDEFLWVSLEDRGTVERLTKYLLGYDPENPDYDQVQSAGDLTISESFNLFHGYMTDNYYVPEDSLEDLSLTLSDLSEDGTLEDDKLLVYGYLTLLCNMYSILQSYRSTLNFSPSQVEENETSEDKKVTSIPYWIYSYMLLRVVGPKSDYLDVQDMKSLLGVDITTSDEVTKDLMLKCLTISSKIAGDASEAREQYCPTIFGDTYIEKYMRLRT